jgi:diketogulonate reductase-like aldo/keto reductase
MTSLLPSFYRSKEMPLIGFGTFIGIEESAIQNYQERQLVTEQTVFGALKSGYRHFDTAQNYGNEEAVGRAFKSAFRELGLKREDIWITAKGDPSKINDTLKKLGVTSVDLFLIHHPNCFDSEESLTTFWKEMDSLVRQGKAEEIGVSNHYLQHLLKILKVCKKNNLISPSANEIETHPKLREIGLVKFCQEHKIKVIAYSPLGYAMRPLILEDPSIQSIAEKITNHRLQMLSKLVMQTVRTEFFATLFGKQSAETFKKHLKQIAFRTIIVAQRVKVTPAQVALAWNISRGVAVIPKSQNEHRMKENLKASTLAISIKDQEIIASLDDGYHCTMTSEQCKAEAEKIVW